MANAAAIHTQSKGEWLAKFQAEEQKRADAMGLNIIEYYMQVENGLLQPTILKLLCHAKAHPKTCPSDCAYQASIKKLEEKFDVR